MGLKQGELNPFVSGGHANAIASGLLVQPTSLQQLQQRQQQQAAHAQKQHQAQQNQQRAVQLELGGGGLGAGVGVGLGGALMKPVVRALGPAACLAAWDSWGSQEGVTASA